MMELLPWAMLAKGPMRGAGEFGCPAACAARVERTRVNEHRRALERLHQRRHDGVCGAREPPSAGVQKLGGAYPS
jgi:hypothetical protein